MSKMDATSHMHLPKCRRCGCEIQPGYSVCNTGDKDCALRQKDQTIAAMRGALLAV